MSEGLTFSKIVQSYWNIDYVIINYIENVYNEQAVFYLILIFRKLRFTANM